MKSLRILSVLIGVLFLVVANVSAGGGPITDLTINADCNSISIVWGPDDAGGYSYISVYKLGGSPHYYNELFEGSGGSFSGPLKPALQEGDQLIIEVTATALTQYSMVQLTVSCNGNSSETTKAIELCADGRSNYNLCNPLAIYPVVSDDGVGMVIYYIARGSDVGEFEIYIGAEDLAALPDEIDSNCSIAISANGLVGVYLLTTGQIQVNVGPDEEGKFFVYRFDSFPSLPTIESYYGGSSLAVLPSCFD